MTDPSLGVPSGTGTTGAGRPPRKKWLLGVVGGVLVLVLAVGGFIAWAAWSSLSNIKHDDLLPSQPTTTTTTAGLSDINFLVTGVDPTPGNAPTVNDLAFLVKVPAARDKVYVTALPSGGQVPAGTSIDHAARIEFAGFLGLTDQLGGVTVNNPVAAKVGSYDWPAGQITLSGAEALMYVRLSSLKPGDMEARRERQLAFVQGLVQKVLSREVLSDPVRLREMVLQLSSHVTVDNQLTDATLIGLLASMKLSSSADIVIG